LPRSQTILVAAPGTELRQSIVFALEADGFSVDPHLSLSAAMASAGASDAALLVVDENALDQAKGYKALKELGRPVILLVDKMRVGTRLGNIKVLTKPLLGRLLTDTVQSVLAMRA
jgi:DNA-binding response OmpR family regulator